MQVGGLVVGQAGVGRVQVGGLVVGLAGVGLVQVGGRGGGLSGHSLETKAFFWYFAGFTWHA